MNSVLSIKGLDKADVLAALYNASIPQSMDLIRFDPNPMTREEAAELLRAAEPRLYFDCIKGRTLNIDLSDSRWIVPVLYDRDNGDGAAERAIESLWEKLTRPDAEECACPMCAGTGKIAKKEAEKWANARRAEVWRQEKHVPAPDAEVDEARFQQMDVAPSEPAPVEIGVDWGVGEAQTFEQVITPLAPLPEEDEEEEIALPNLEIPVAGDNRLKSAAIDEERFAQLNSRPKVFWGLFINYRGESGMRYLDGDAPFFGSRKEALAAANQRRRLGLNITVDRVSPEQVQAREESGQSEQEEPR